MATTTLLLHPTLNLDLKVAEHHKLLLVEQEEDMDMEAPGIL